jgi:MFS family permease
MLTPGSLALIGATFDDSQRGKAIGTWSSVTAMMAALGPGLGGYLAQHASWRWIFFINVPIAIAVVVVALRGVPESKDRERVHVVDWPGAAACTAGLGAIVYGLTFSAPIWIVAGLLALGAFVAIEARSPAPLVPLSLFGSRTFSGVNALTLFLYGALAGALFFLPFEMIQIDGYSPTAAGFAFLPFVMFIFVLSPITGGLVRTVGARLPLVVGPLLTAGGFIVLALSAGRGSYWSAYLPAIVMMGVGMATAVAPLTTAVMESVDADRMGAASGVNNAISRVAGMLAIAGLGLLMLNVFSTHLDQNMMALRIPDNIRSAVFANRYALAETTAPAGVDSVMTVVVRMAVVPAFQSAFRETMFACAGLAALGALIAGLTIDPRAK